MAIKVKLILPEDPEGLEDSILDFLVEAAMQSHKPTEIEAILNKYESREVK